MKKPKEPLLIEKEGRLFISGVWAYYFLTTFGVTPYFFEKIVNEALKEKYVI